MSEESEFDLEIDSIIEAIKKKEYGTVLLQFPDGLKQRATDIAGQIEKETEANVLIWVDSCYGACDLPHLPHELKLDLIVQFGHAEMPTIKTSVPMMFIEAYLKVDVLPVVKESIGSLSEKVGVITTVQHIQKLDDVKEFLMTNGFEVHIGEAQGRVTHNGQVLGCNMSSATSISSKVQCFLYIGGGNFHPIGVALATEKPVIVADPIQNEVRDVADIKERWLRQRFGAITKAKEASNFGIIISTKEGQMRIKRAMELRDLARKHDKIASILLLNEIDPSKLIGLELGAFVSCGCPRIAIDDFLRFNVPILTPFEFEVVLGEKKWEDYRFDTLS
jgi:2-(3-amino-3-carboxypropyl)histidine synthase